jgi:replication initiation and membrane attachment protein DnaB
MKKTHIPQPQNVRKIQGSFAWIDHRLMRDGYLPIMTHEDLGLYLFLTLVADRNGVSFYRKEKICDTLSLSFQQFEIARDRLVDLNLIAYQSYSVMSPNGFYQVLPIRTPAPNLAQKVLQKVSEQWANA